MNKLFKKAVLTSGLLLASFLTATPGYCTQYLQTYGDSGSLLLPNGADSQFLNPIVIQHAKVTLATADVLALSATPKLLVAGVANKTTIVHGMSITVTPGGTQFASGGAVVAQYHTGAVAATATVAAAKVNAASANYNVVLPVAAAAVQGDNIELTNGTGAFTTGNGSVTVDIWYAQF